MEKIISISCLILPFPSELLSLANLSICKSHNIKTGKLLLIRNLGNNAALVWIEIAELSFSS